MSFHHFLLSQRWQNLVLRNQMCTWKIRGGMMKSAVDEWILLLFHWTVPYLTLAWATVTKIKVWEQRRQWTQWGSCIWCDCLIYVDRSEKWWSRAYVSIKMVFYKPLSQLFSKYRNKSLNLFDTPLKKMLLWVWLVTVQATTCMIPRDSIHIHQSQTHCLKDQN